eukprot:jgi/Ulvmu1/1124/UM106_0041.1
MSCLSGANGHDGSAEQQATHSSTAQRIGSLVCNAPSIISASSLPQCFSAGYSFATSIPLPVRQRAVPCLDMATAGEVPEQELEQQLASQPKPITFELWSRRLGMHADAVVAWGALHERPGPVVLLHWLAELIRAAIDYLTFVYGLPAGQLVFKAMAGLAIATSACKWPGLWRYGPAYADSVSLNAYLLLYVVCILPPIMAAFVQDEDNIPFRNRLKSTLLIALNSFLNNFTGLTGQLKNELPVVPMSSISRPVILACLQTARVVDGLTDINLVGILLDMVRYHSC